ncbi:MAG: hypothetical protein NTZ98_13235, partial [Acidobacteria bacterium]|nr:hypothetical protein [Acidobacteriota bacterium]
SLATSSANRESAFIRGIRGFHCGQSVESAKSAASFLVAAIAASCLCGESIALATAGVGELLDWVEREGKPYNTTTYG